MYITSQVLDPFNIEISNGIDMLYLIGFGHPDELDKTLGLPTKGLAFGLVKKLWLLFNKPLIQAQTSESKGLGHHIINQYEDQFQSYIKSTQCSKNRKVSNFLIDYWRQRGIYTELQEMATSLISIPSCSRPYSDFLQSKLILNTSDNEHGDFFVIRHILSLRSRQKI